jgi:mucolipin 3
LSIYDSIVILISLISFSLVARSLYRSQKLKKETNRFFKTNYGKELSKWDKMEFLDMWYVLIIVNDILTVGGSFIKIQIVNKDSFHYDVCGMLLGTGNLFVWFGVLRYLGFFEKYNVLILTLKKATPNVLRFLLCASVFYLGFIFCGWVVLGPYHIKFRSIATASECLFSLVNGDDMFVTFSAINNKKSYVWVYSRIYLYLFISLFIYVVLSVFISVIMDAYETIKYCYEHGFPKSELMEFIDSCTEDANSPLYRSDTMEEDDNSCGHCRNIIPCCRRTTPEIEVTEHTSLIS